MLTISEMPPDYNSFKWHNEMLKSGNLYRVVENNKIIGGAIRFEDKEEKKTIHWKDIYRCNLC